MSVTSDDRMMGVDIETTSLDPDASILEIAMVLLAPDLTVLARRTHVVGWPTIRVMREQAPEVVRLMHDASGLWKECDRPGRRTNLGAVEADLVWWAVTCGVQPGTIPMFGASLRADRAWLEYSMPALHGLFHYRSVDVSTIREAASRWCGDTGPTDVPPQHRAAADIDVSIGLARYYKDRYFTHAASDAEDAGSTATGISFEQRPAVRRPT